MGEENGRRRAVVSAIPGKETKAPFDDIIALYKNGLILYLYRLVGDWHTAEDLSEDCFVELIVHPRRYRFSVRTENLPVRHRPPQGLFPPSPPPGRPLRFSGGRGAAWPTTPIRPAGPTNGKGARRSAGPSNSLPKDYGDVLYLRYFEELSPQEIAQVMRKTLKQVYNLSSRAKAALKNLLERDDFFDEIG